MSVMKSLLSVAKVQHKFRCETIWQSNFTDWTARTAESARFLLFILHIIILLLFYVHHVCLARINSQFTVLAQCVIRDGADRPRVYNIWLLCFVLIQFIYAHTILICLRTRSCIMYYFICTHISCVIDRPVYTTESNNND